MGDKRKILGEIFFFCENTSQIKNTGQKLISLHLTPQGLRRKHRAKLLKVLCAVINNVHQKHHIQWVRVGKLSKKTPSQQSHYFSNVNSPVIVNAPSTKLTLRLASKEASMRLLCTFLSSFLDFTDAQMPIPNTSRQKATIIIRPGILRAIVDQTVSVLSKL